MSSSSRYSACPCRLQTLIGFTAGRAEDTGGITQAQKHVYSTCLFCPPSSINLPVPYPARGSCDPASLDSPKHHFQTTRSSNLSSHNINITSTQDRHYFHTTYHSGTMTDRRRQNRTLESYQPFLPSNAVEDLAASLELFSLELFSILEPNDAE